LKQASFFEAAGGLSLKPTTIMNFSLPKSVKRSVDRDTLNDERRYQILLLFIVVLSFLTLLPFSLLIVQFIEM